MEREQIIKALECCGTSDKSCSSCPLAKDYSPCSKTMADNALSLIKELTEEVESLKQAMEHEHASFMEIFGQWSDKCERLTEENERLKAIPEQLHKEMSERMLEERKIERKLAVRKFAERLKAETITIQDHTGKLGSVVLVSTIDQIVKEMLEENK